MFVPLQLPPLGIRVPIAKGGEGRAIHRRFRVSNFIQISIGDERRFVTIEPLPQGDRAFNPTPFRKPVEGGTLFPPTTKGLRP